MADDIFFNDLRAPFISTNVAAVTLAATAKALYTPSFFPVLGGQYFKFIGKKIKIRLFGRITTGLTPGNGQFTVFYGSGADATGVSLATSAAFALLPSQTDVSWMIELYIHCRSTGNTGTLFVDGEALFNEAVSVAHLLIPTSAPVVSGACDLTAANIISVQFSRSGSTAETMQVHDMEVIALN